MSESPKPFPILIGMTATGKTKLLEQITRPTFIVNADSRQVYKGMDIGTAKPSKSIQARHPHVGIDVIEPDESFDVARFIQLADSAIVEAKRAKKPYMVVGGAGFYIRHFLHGINKIDPIDSDIRKRIQIFVQNHGNQAAHEYLQSIDPQSAQAIHIHDTYRITRALEIYEQTGKPRSAFSMYDKHRKIAPYTLLGIQCDPSILARRIAQRVETMFAEGLAQEVKKLKNKGYSLQHQAMHCIGYKEFFITEEWLNDSHDSSLFDKIKNTIVQQTISFAKRQRIFFKRFLPAKWYDISELDKLVVHLDALLS